jgi:hypothetical protein
MNNMRTSDRMDLNVTGHGEELLMEKLYGRYEYEDSRR